MNHYIKSRKHAPKRTSPVLTTATLTAAVAMALPAIAAASDDDKKPNDEAQTLDAVQVRGSWFAPASSKFTAELVNTPKTVNIVTEKVLQETGATSLQDALRMVPGIAFSAGEGGNPTGDRPFIRGFDGQSNTFIDGMRDVGMQTREIFNLEQVEVVKGPSSAYDGRNSGGGSINLVSKTPKLKDETRVSLGAGTDNYYRATVDANAVLGDGVAARLNIMKHDSDIAGRDVANFSRFGIAPSVGFGLNGDTQLIASYYHLETNDMPDAGGFPYGDPETTTVTGSPYVTNRNAYYGLKDRDFQKTKANIGTLDFSHSFGAHKLRNVLRSGKTENDYIWTQPDDSKNNPLTYGTLWRRWNTRDAETKSLADQLSLSGAFATGGINHAYSIGAEYSNEKTRRGSYSFTPTTNYNNTVCSPSRVGAASGYNCTDFTNPNPNDPWTSLHTITRSNPALDIRQENKTASVYAFDTIELSPKWLVNLGLRWDDYEAEMITPSATAAATVLHNKNDFLNYQAGIVFKPTGNGSIYLSYGTSSSPPGMDGGDGLDGALSAAIQDLKPQETSNIELGVKWNVFDNRLSLSGAVFHTVMDNARVTIDNGTTQNAGEKKIDGVEIGFTGQITREWSIYGGYTWLDSELSKNGYVCAVSGRTCPSGIYVSSPNNGNVFPNTSEHSANLWTTYALPFGLTLGGGATYASRQYANVANTQWIPGYTRWDAMASYAFGERYSVQLNVQNLTDKLYFNKAYAAHFAGIAPGRSATLAFNVKF